MKKKTIKILIAIGLISFLGYFALLFCQDMYFWPLSLLGRYMLTLAIGGTYIPKQHMKYGVLSITTANMIFLVCIISYGIGSLPYYAVGFALSVLLHVKWKSMRYVRIMSFVSMLLVLLSTCYFAVGSFTMLSRVAIAVEVIAIVYGLIVGSKSDDSNGRKEE